MSELLDEIGRIVAEDCPDAYFVGGCVRDMLRGEPIKDADFVVRGDTQAIGRALARRFDGHFFWLRQEDDVARVLLPSHDGLQIDFTRLKSTLEEDLAARDLTINAMAAPAAGGLHSGVEVIDLAGGREDLAGRLVRFVSPAAPEADPLRTLRALRFRWKLGFTLEEGTAARLRECVPLLARVSTERIRDELFQLLAMPDPTGALAEFGEAGVLPWLTGAPAEAIADPRAPAERVRGLLPLLADPSPDLTGLLAAETTPPRHRREVLLWAAALQPLTPGVEPGEAARHLALSNPERQLITKGLRGAGAVRELVDRWPAPGRSVRRAFRLAGPAGPEAVLLDAATHRWEHAHEELMAEALQRHFWPEAPLLTGVEVMQLTGLEPGPELGRVLEQIEDARADSLFRTPEEAVLWLRERFRG